MEPKIRFGTDEHGTFVVVVTLGSWRLCTTPAQLDNVKKVYVLFGGQASDLDPAYDYLNRGPAKLLSIGLYDDEEEITSPVYTVEEGTE